LSKRTHYNAVELMQVKVILYILFQKCIALYGANSTHRCVLFTIYSSL